MIEHIAHAGTYNKWLYSCYIEHITYTFKKDKKLENLP